MPVVASATLEVTPVLAGAQQSLTEQLTGAAAPAAEAAGKESGSKLGGSLVKGLATGTAAVAGAVAGASAAIIGATGATAEYGDQIDKASQKLGVSSTFYQEWEAVLQHSGTSMDSMSASFKKLATASQDASDDQVKAFEAIGLSMDQVASMSTEDLFASVVGGLQGMEEGTERTALATQLLGRGAMEMGALFNTSAEDTQGMIDRVHELGGVMGEDAVKASARYQDSLQDMKTSFSGIKNGIAADLLPVMADFMDGVGEFVSTTDLSPITDVLGSAFSALGDFISGIDIAAVGDTIQTVVSGIGDVVSTAWGVIQTVFGSLQTAFGSISDALGETGTSWKDVWGGIQDVVKRAADMVGAAIELIGEVIAWLIEQVQTDGTIFNQVWEEMQTIVSAAYDVISEVIDMISALLNGDWSAAWESAKAIVSTVWEAVKSIVLTQWETIKSYALSIWNAIKEAVSKPIETVKATLSNAWENIKSKATGTWNGIKSTASSVWNSIKTAVMNPINTLKSLLSSAWSGIRSTASSAWSRIRSAITSPIESAKSTVSNAISRIRGLFPLSIGRIFSNLRLPHFNISGGTPPYGLGGLGTKPSISVSWYAKAMNNPYMFSDATLFGAGETGDEILYGRDALLRDIKEATSGRGVTNYITVNGAEDPEAWAQKFARQMKMELRMA